MYRRLGRFVNLDYVDWFFLFFSVAVVTAAIVAFFAMIDYRFVFVTMVLVLVLTSVILAGGRR